MADGEKDSPQGPTDPHGPGGIDAPAPPGGPQRTDAPGGSDRPDTEQPEQPERHPEAVHGDDDTEPRTERGQRDLQQENAETSLDQPSQ